jgi:hypothetical protein
MATSLALIEPMELRELPTRRGSVPIVLMKPLHLRPSWLRPQRPFKASKKCDRQPY